MMPADRMCHFIGGLPGNITDCLIWLSCNQSGARRSKQLRGIETGRCELDVINMSGQWALLIGSPCSCWKLTAQPTQLRKRVSINKPYRCCFVLHHWNALAYRAEPVQTFKARRGSLLCTSAATGPPPAWPGRVPVTESKASSGKKASASPQLSKFGSSSDCCLALSCRGLRCIHFAKHTPGSCRNFPSWDLQVSSLTCPARHACFKQ